MSFDILKILPHYLIPKQGLSVFAGCVANVKNTRIKNYIIRRFIHKFGVNMDEALVENPDLYPSFNEFFIRHLKPECRPLSKADIIAPVDGCVSALGFIHEGQLIQAKGHHYSVEELLACDARRAQQFKQGAFATLYLSPKDYHRVHMPVDATLHSMTFIPGALFSVQPLTTRMIPKLFARNQRLIVNFDTAMGPMVMVLVGATIVGSIGTNWHGDLKRTKKSIHFDYTQKEKLKTLRQGEEMGFFKLGSTVVLLFGQEHEIQWNHGLQAGSTIRFGEALACYKKEHVMNYSSDEPKPHVPPLEDPPLPDSYEPSPGETPPETPKEE